MGALPSKKYDIVLESFCKYLIENYSSVGYGSEDTNTYWKKSFLEALDKKEWEI